MMPIPLCHRFMNVQFQSIIDCFEIEIQKPQSPRYQALTWLEYKKCNTVKVLILANPFDFINFISSGYEGRISDRAILEESQGLCLSSCCFRKIKDLPGGGRRRIDGARSESQPLC